mmetsp:Transcript_34678/g.35371  ORF Transcript_34678/g.35371 Transcript_34678/m.35371 type:complete len:152 (+) Transcript_34678:51-506(+)
MPTETEKLLLEGIIKKFTSLPNSHPDFKSDFLRCCVFSFNEGMPTLESVIDVLESGMVREITCRTSGRSIWKVYGSKGVEYICLSSYCPCRSFYEQARSSSVYLVCKHLLAIQLAKPLGRLTVQVVSDDVFLDNVCGIEDCTIPQCENAVS